ALIFNSEADSDFAQSLQILAEKYGVYLESVQYLRRVILTESDLFPPQFYQFIADVYALYPQIDPPRLDTRQFPALALGSQLATHEIDQIFEEIGDAKLSPQLHHILSSGTPDEKKGESILKN